MIYFLQSRTQLLVHRISLWNINDIVRTTHGLEYPIQTDGFQGFFLDISEILQTPGDELKWVRNAAEEDTVALASQRGMVVCVGCNDDKVRVFLSRLFLSLR